MSVPCGPATPALAAADFDRYNFVIGIASRMEGRGESYQNKALLLLQTKDFTSAVNETAPRLLVHVHDCSFSVSDPLHRHGMATYKSEGAR